MKFEGIRCILFDYEIAEMPQEAIRLKNRILVTQIFSTVLFDIFSFSIKCAQYSIAHGFNLLAIIFLTAYFMKQVLSSSVQTYTDTQKNAFSSISDSFITETVSQIANTVRGKVLQQKNGYSNLMTNSEVIMLLKEYISFIWSFWQELPIVVSNIITATVMAIAVLITEFIQTKNTIHTIVFSIILFVCIISFIILFKIRIKVRDSFRRKYRESRKENEVLMNDIRNIEPLIQKEFSFRVSLLVKNLVSRRSMEKKEVTHLNLLQILRSFILGIFMVAIIILKVSYVGGLTNLSLDIMTDILAVSTIYSNILDKIATILRDLEMITHTIKEAENTKEDVDTIMDIFYFEAEKEVSNETVTAIAVNPFRFSYPGSTSIYELINSNTFVLEKGKAYGVYAPTGAGKSTLMHILTGKILLDESPISYGDECNKAYLASIMNEANGLLGSQLVLDEITLGEEPITHKLLRILKGTHIYYDILRNLGLEEENDNKVLEYLSATTISQYSSGQKQRLGIVKLLYNMTEDHQIIVFDEATNALDDETAKKVLRFISSFCQEDVPRIVLFVSHQEKITKEITDGTINLVQNHFPSWEIIKS